MIDEYDKAMETELLKRISEKGKVNLMTEIHSIMDNGRLSYLCHSSLTTFVQKQFLESNLLFKYKLLNSRNGIKIVELYESYKPQQKDIEAIIDFAAINEKEIIHLFNQFYDVSDKVNIAEIALVYKAITKSTNSSFICLDNNLINLIYKNSNNYFKTITYVEEVIKDIIKYGYCFKRNNQYYWKMYADTTINNEEIDQFFTVNELDLEDEKNPDEMQNQLIDKNFTTQDALSLLAKELGFLPIENTKSKLEEVLAITDELIDDFDSMKDWEKLMNWKNFVSNWKTIMGDALNGNN